MTFRPTVCGLHQKITQNRQETRGTSFWVGIWDNCIYTIMSQPRIPLREYIHFSFVCAKKLLSELLNSWLYKNKLLTCVNITLLYNKIAKYSSQ